MQDTILTIRFMLTVGMSATFVSSYDVAVHDVRPQPLGFSGTAMSLLGAAGFLIVAVLSVWQLFNEEVRLGPALYGKLPGLPGACISLTILLLGPTGTLAFVVNAYRYVETVGFVRLDAVLEYLGGSLCMAILALWTFVPLLADQFLVLRPRLCCAR